MAKSLQEINQEYYRHMEQKRSSECIIRGNSGERSRGKKYKISIILSNLIFYGAIGMLLFVAVTVSAGDADGTIMGYRYYHILSSSMESVYPRGSFVIVKDVEKEEIGVGDDITFYTDPSTVVTHRVIDIVEDCDGSGARGYQTQGTESLNPDPDITHEANVAGKVVWSIPKLGMVMELAKEHMVFAFIIFIAAMAASFLIKMIWRERREVNCG